jgi:uncharacterized membrane protein HdeD (DUF308 family)
MADVRQDILDNARQLGRWIGLRGLITLAFGILFLARPGSGVVVLLAVFGVYCLFDGIFALSAAITGATLRSRGWLAFEGLLSIAAGILAFALPGNVAIVILYVVAIRALVIGAIEIVAAIRLGNSIPSPWLVALTGILSVAFGVLLARNPQAGILSLAWLVGVYGVVLGVAQMAAAVALRRALKQAPPLRPTPA